MPNPKGVRNRYCPGCKEKRWPGTFKLVGGREICRACAGRASTETEDEKFDRIWKEKGFETVIEPTQRYAQYLIGEKYSHPFANAAKRKHSLPPDQDPEP